MKEGTGKILTKDEGITNENLGTN
jgi:hypothetical protein